MKFICLNEVHIYITYIDQTHFLILLPLTVYALWPVLVYKTNLKVRILQRVGRTPWAGDQPVRRPLPTKGSRDFPQYLQTDTGTVLFIINRSTKSWYKLMYYRFRLIVAIIRYTEPLQSPVLLSAIPSYTGHCLHIGSALYKYVVYVMPLCYELY
jgi:hypothetical protein